jgi:50S ribosomal protein L16 3-hydroxylase
MLRTWLSPVSVEQFVQAHLGRAPYAQPSSAVEALPWFDWDVLDQVLRATPEPDVLVATGGRLVQAPPPRSRGDVRRLMARKYGVVVRAAERHHPQLAVLAREFERDLPGEVHIQLYVTPAGTQTFGWHYDCEEVFIAQTAGIKDYYLRANTVAPVRVMPERPDFSAVMREKSPLLSARLIPGDWLYIPAPWWHLVRSLEDALSISVGIRPRSNGSAPPQCRDDARPALGS